MYSKAYLPLTDTGEPLLPDGGVTCNGVIKSALIYLF